MSSPQFDRKSSTIRWYSLTYQSNDILDKKVYQSSAIEIAKNLTDKFQIKEIHNYLHGNLIFAAYDNFFPDTEFDHFWIELTGVLPKHIPKLFFNLCLVSKSASIPNKCFMYLDGSDELDISFLEAIHDVHINEVVN